MGFTSTPEEFNPRQFFEDNANPDTVAQPIPAITTTYFPPVVATMPPLILDDVEQKVTEEQVGASSRDVISVSLFILSLLISLFAKTKKYYFLLMRYYFFLLILSFKINKTHFIQID